MQDRVDQILGQWKRERPDLDVRPMGVIGRIQRATAALRPLLDETHEASGLQSESYDVLASLRRSGPPHQLSPTDLYREMMLTSGAMTNRIDRLEEGGLVARRADPDDRRGTLVRLTPKGKTLVDNATTKHVANEERLLSALTVREQQQLSELLRKLLIALGDTG